MKLPDLAELALRNLRESVLRNSLTTVGISVGVASLVAMLSLGIGLQQLASRRLMKSGLFDTVVVTSRRDPRNFGRDREETNNTAPGESRVLDEPARQEMEKLPNVLEAYPDIRFVTELAYENKPHLTMVAAMPQSARTNDAFDTIQGQFFSSDTADEVVIQKVFAEELLGRVPKPGVDETDVKELAPPLLGKELTMRYAQRDASGTAPTIKPDEGNGPAVGDFAGAAYSVVSRQLKLKIVGVIDLDPESMRGSTRARVFLPLGLARDLHVMEPTDLREVSRAASGEQVYGSVSVRVKSPGQIENVEKEIKKLGFSAFSIIDASTSIKQFFRILDIFLGIFGSLALAVAFVGIVNTLVMAILERRREIGIMKALGASDGDVKKLFFAEAGAMGIIGGIAGVVLGWAIGQVINMGTNVYLKRQSLSPEHFWSVPLWLVGFAILFAFVVSLVAGLYPAGRAAKLDPVQALRYE